ncbi:glycosyltransferase [Acidipila sp. EB88]|uniref:glycosyltransferase n=1 Tax=Acidipila sp. EB88 TaxID=2305226 RepID=UPI000F5EE2AF|nr:glycosyltransferase [Acidipila sp. EB88]RRA47451.1 glycosyltransferase [Acidipila sp. EB88]
MPRWFADGYRGVPVHPVFAFNSASLVRVDALAQMGGYDPYFWLDNSDARMFRNLALLGKQVFVAGDIRVQHEFSMKSMQESMSPWRYRQVLLAESAFWDREMNVLAGLERTLRLALRMVKHRRRGDARELRSITAAFLRLRLFRSRAHRQELFRRSVELHLGAALPGTALPPRPPRVSICIAACNASSYVDSQLASILPQLGLQDEVVLVDDGSADDTAERVRGRQDLRIRVVEHARSMGTIPTFEAALRNATGDILFVAQGTGTWAPDTVARFMRAFHQHPAAKVLLGASTADLAVKALQPRQLQRGSRFRSAFLRLLRKNRERNEVMALRSGVLQQILPPA